MITKNDFVTLRPRVSPLTGDTKSQDLIDNLAFLAHI
jgi:hypothetical protein